MTSGIDRWRPTRCDRSDVGRPYGVRTMHQNVATKYMACDTATAPSASRTGLGFTDDVQHIRGFTDDVIESNGDSQSLMVEG